MKHFLILVGICCYLCPCCRSQDNHPSQLLAENLIGEWKLSKKTRKEMDRYRRFFAPPLCDMPVERIKIEPQNGRFRISYHSTDSKNDFSYLTNFGGEEVERDPPLQEQISTFIGGPRVSAVDKYTFIEQTSISSIKLTVSSDGKTLTRLVMVFDARCSDRKQIFDKVVQVKR